MRHLGFWLLGVGGVLIFGTLPFSYGDGGSRATEEGGGFLGWLSICGILLLLAGGGLLAWSASKRRRAGRE